MPKRSKANGGPAAKKARKGKKDAEAEAEGFKKAAEPVSTGDIKIKDESSIPELEDNEGSGAPESDPTNHMGQKTQAQVKTEPKSDSASQAVALSSPVAPIDVGTPAQTIYINNLNDKINKNDLKRILYLLFSTYGHIIDIVALKTPKMRGQAHIAFSDVNGASVALKELQGFELLGKRLRIRFAKTESAAISRIRGVVPVPAPVPAVDGDVPMYDDTPLDD